MKLRALFIGLTLGLATVAPAVADMNSDMNQFF
uniref:Uncharacterized protein n=2 Tax=Serratia TaxID=613 RepID=A0A1C3HN38_SERMA|nr:Uncharacterised protein [Serratia marcescens]